MGSLRIGSSSDESRRLTNGLGRESRRLKKSGFRVEAARLALADSMDRLKFGSRESSESKAEAGQLTEAQDRQAVIERLKLAAGGKPSLIPSTNASPTVPSSGSANAASSSSSPALGVSGDNTTTPKTVIPFDSEAAKDSRSNDRRSLMRAELDRITGTDDEAGNLDQLEVKNAKLAERKRLADLLKANAGNASNLQPEIDAIDKARAGNADLLRKLNKEVRIGGVRIPQYER